jgi:sarcosine oxidase subunit alpha
MIEWLSSGRTGEIPEGAMIIAPGADKTAIGHVTSAGHGVGVGRPIALALLEAGTRRMGETVHAVSPCRRIRVPARVSEPCAFDPEGDRLVQQM